MRDLRARLKRLEATARQEATWEISPIEALVRGLLDLGPDEPWPRREAVSRPGRNAAPGGAAEWRRLVDQLLADRAIGALPPVSPGPEDARG